MVAALEHCDALVSGHSYEALVDVVEAIGAPSGKSGDPPALSFRTAVALPEDGEPSGERHAGAWQLGCDAERLWPEQGQNDTGMGDR